MKKGEKKILTDDERYGDGLLPYRAFARKYGVTTQFVRILIRTDRIPHLRVGDHLYVYEKGAPSLLLDVRKEMTGDDEQRA